MATSTRKRALQVWKTHGENKPRDPGAVVIHGPGPGGAGCLQAAALLHVSVDGLAKIRRRAYAKIADDMQG